MENIEKKANEIISQKGELSPSDLEQIVSSTIEAFYEEIRRAKALPHISPRYLATVRRKYSASIRRAQKRIFEKIPISRKHSKMLLEFAVGLSNKRVFPFPSTGLVIAGFGNDEIYPSFREYEVCNVLEGVLKFSSSRNGSITNRQNASITPFAQGDMVSAFMEGAAPSYQQAVAEFVGAVLNDYPTELLNQIPGLAPSRQNTLKKKFQEIRTRVLDEFKNQMGEFREENYINPVVRAVSVLSKDMLAEVAESLVNLTSFKRRISMDAAETVGGPIDVAVISHGDGFVWIKRKHYFNPDLNPHFLKNYFGDYHHEIE